MRPLSALLLLIAARAAQAENCRIISYTTCDDNIVHWYDPDTGEVCDPHDCGGGRAPPKTDVPGCPLYTGTEIYTPTTSTLSCWPFTTAADVESTGDVESTSDVESSAPTTSIEAETGAEEPSTTQPPTSSTKTEESERDSTSADETGGDADLTDEDGQDGGSAGETGAGIRGHGSWITVAGVAIGAVAFL